MALGLVGIEGIADILDVSEGRVRQLIMQESFPRPVVALGPRNRVWSSSSIRDYKRSRRERTTLLSATLPKVGAPLPRILDEVVTAHQNWYPPSVNVYVRAWQGEGYTVALISGVEPFSGLSGTIEYIVASLADQLPLVLGGEVCWIVESLLTNPGGTTNVVMGIPVPGEFSDPSWSPLSYEDLVDVVGERVEMYPRGTLTEENLRRFKTVGGAVELPVNDGAIAGHVEELEELRHAPLLPEQLAYAQDLVAQMLRWQDEAGRRREGETTDPEWQRESADVVWAVRRRYRVLTDSERSLAEEHFTDGPVVDGLAMATVEGLIAWLLQVDEYSTSPRPREARVARSLAEGVAKGLADTSLREKYLDRLEHDITGRVVRMVARDYGPARYLAGRHLYPVDADARQREHRILAGALREDEHRTVAFGRDLFGNHIALDSTGTLAVIWPGTAKPAGPDDQLQLDGRTDTIATVIVDGKPSHLLPRSYHPASWASGYEGGSPADLVVAVSCYLEASGLPLDKRAVRDFVTSSELPETRTVQVRDLLMVE